MLNYPSLNIVSDEVICNLDVFGPIMKKWILKEFYSTLIVTLNYYGPQLHTKYPNQQHVKPYDLKNILNGCHILCLSRAQSC
jgi:hypothetical protein